MNDNELPENKMTRYIVRWFVPALHQWIDVATEMSLQTASDSELFFRKSMKDYWKGELRIAIVEVIEKEI